jgi:hypothetical protein
VDNREFFKDRMSILIAYTKQVLQGVKKKVLKAAVIVESDE